MPLGNKVSELQELKDRRSRQRQIRDIEERMLLDNLDSTEAALKGSHVRHKHGVVKLSKHPDLRKVQIEVRIVIYILILYVFCYYYDLYLVVIFCYYDMYLHNSIVIFYGLCFITFCTCNSVVMSLRCIYVFTIIFTMYHVKVQVVGLVKWQMIAINLMHVMFID